MKKEYRIGMRELYKISHDLGKNIAAGESVEKAILHTCERFPSVPPKRIYSIARFIGYNVHYKNKKWEIKDITNL